jgi:hypothetical protein
MTDFKIYQVISACHGGAFSRVPGEPGWNFRQVISELDRFESYFPDAQVGSSGSMWVTTDKIVKVLVR